jgi:hypothetical protein
MRRTIVVVVAGLLTACASQVAQPPPSTAQRPPGFPERLYLESAGRGQPVFEVEPALSLVVIEVRRAGSLAQLGHDHVVASHDVHGYIAAAGRADLYVRLDSLVVDEPELRRQAGFDTQPSDAAIAGTRENMLSKLRAEEHPYALVQVKNVEDNATGSQAEVAITLNDVSRDMRVPLKVEKTAAQLSVTGNVALMQTNFGIVPYSILGGGLQVQDRVDVRFAIRASRIAP